MTTALIYFGASGGLLLLLTILYLFEDAKGGRILLSRFRGLLDRVAATVLRTIVGATNYLWHAIAQFILRHGIRKIVKAGASYLRQLEQNIEEKVLHHRKQRGFPKREPNHLDEIAAHKELTALSDDERQRLRND